MEINYSNKFQNKEIYDLVYRAKKGDEMAYKELLTRYYKAVFYLIKKMVKNETDAEDLTIEVFTKVFMNIDMYTETHSFSTWLFKIASNHAIDFIRKHKNSKNLLNIDQPLDEETNWFFELASVDPNPEKFLISKQKQNNINDIIDVLPQELSEVIKLRVYEDLSYKEISETLGLAIGTVKARIFRARNLLSSILNRKRS